MSSAPQTAHSDAHTAHGGHEERDVNLTPVVLAGIGLLVLLLVAAVAMFGLYDVLMTREARLSPPANPLVASAGPRLPPQPRLQADPIKDLEELRAAEDKLLTSYGWVDRNAGTVRIPVARAIDLLAERAGQAGATP